MKILVTKFKSIGDVILLTPLLKNLKLSYPDAEIDLLVQSGTQDVLKNNPNISKIFLTNSKNISRLRNFFYDLYLLLLIRQRKYDLLIVTDRGERGAFLSRFSKAKRKIGRKDESSKYINSSYTDFFSYHGDRHIIELNLDPINILGRKIQSYGLEIYPQKSDFEFVKKKMKNIKKFIHLHPSSQRKYKTLDSQLLAEIIDFCEEILKVKVVLTGNGEDDQNQIKSILSLVSSKPINLCNKLSIMQTAALNKMADILIVVDTAIMHISTANNTPVIAFFGPTAVNNWGPWDRSLDINSYVRKGGVQMHGMHKVISGKEVCIPCSKSGCDDSGASMCLKNIQMETIKKEIKNSLGLLHL